MLSRLFAIIAPVAICVAVGLVLELRGRSLPKKEIGWLVSDVGAPALIFHALATAKLEPALLVQMAGATSLAIAMLGVIGFVLVRITGWPVHTFVPPVIFSNSGNMGLPLCLFAFGEEVLGLAVACFAMFTVWQFSLGLWIWSGKSGFAELVRTPIMWATVLGFACCYFGIVPPQFLANTCELIGSFAIPMMLIMLGVSLASMRATNLSRAIVVSLVRLAAGPLVGFLVADWLGLSGVTRGVLVLECAMPVAVFNYLLAVRFERAADEVAGLIVISTALSMLSLPAVLSILL